MDIRIPIVNNVINGKTFFNEVNRHLLLSHTHHPSQMNRIVTFIPVNIADRMQRFHCLDMRVIPIKRFEAFNNG